jgi:hypothetical protein
MRSTPSTAYKFVVLEALTGFGKSPVAISVSVKTSYQVPHDLARPATSLS